MQQHSDRVLAIFKEIANIPRCSGQEGRFRMWLQAWADTHGFTPFADAGGNLLIQIPGSLEYEDASPVVIQGHMDMVCEKSPMTTHDFSKEPLSLREEDEWLSANHTTLGADNGIGIAIALALATDAQVKHPPLELLFTVEEEIGLLGAQRIASEFLEGNTLINLDSEEEGVVIIGCAGGQETMIKLDLELESCPDDYALYRLKIAGLAGGHSGIEIHKRHANVLKVMANLLHSLPSGWYLASLDGGSAHNVIPREATAVLALPNKQANTFQKYVNTFSKQFRAQHQNERTAAFTLLPLEDSPKRIYHPRSVGLMMDLIFALPHGVVERHQDMLHIVETSNNLATLHTHSGQVRITSSQRSSVPSKLAEHTQRIEAIARLAGAETESGGGYPGWEPDPNSKLVRKCQDTYLRLFGTMPKVEVIHAGLECGVFAKKYPDMEMISFGPTIHHAHSPQEKVYLPSIGRVYALTAALLSELK